MAKNSNEVDIKLKGFYKRWKIDISEDEKWQEFKNRVLNAYEKHLGYEFCLNLKSKMNFMNYRSS
jgi:hypothetical protein